MLSNTLLEEDSPPISLVEEYSDVLKALDDVETILRLQHHPTLTERAPPLEVDEMNDLEQTIKDDERTCDNTIAPKSIIASLSENGVLASLRRLALKEIFTIRPEILPKTLSAKSSPFESILILDVSHNELTDLPGLSLLKNLEKLDLNRNWFNALPSEIGMLHELQTLIASRNFLRPNNDSLQLEALRSMKKLKVLDLRYNQKCGRPFHRDKVRDELLPLTPTIHMTLWEESNRDGTTGAQYVGSSAAVRNPVLLRSQLEPLGTVALRKRLVCDFGQAPTDPSKVDRAGVMKDLLMAYFHEGLAYFPDANDCSKGGDNDGNETKDEPDYNALIADRKTLQLYGTPVPKEKLDQLMEELKKWTSYTGLINKNRERPSIHARNYMILRRPKSREEVAKEEEKLHGHSDKKSRRAIRKAKKLERYRRLWELGIAALRGVDPVYADQKCTEIAVTYGFSGSPHRDKQNCGPFYGLSLGNFDNSRGKGGIVVESSARVIVQMDTKNRIGRVDGRYVHWVAPWGSYVSSGHQSSDENPMNTDHSKGAEERYSLIYYETGHDFIKPGPAVFSIPGKD